MTYGQLAKRFGIHPRTVASLLSKNGEQDLYPCFRVVHSDRSVGGYNLGQPEKIRRLRADGVEFDANGRVVTRCVWMLEDASGE